MSMVENTFDTPSIQPHAELIIPEEDLIKYKKCLISSNIKSILYGTSCGLTAHIFMSRLIQKPYGNFIGFASGVMTFVISRVVENITCGQKVLRESEYLQQYTRQHRIKWRHASPLPQATLATEKTSESTTDTQQNDMEFPYSTSDYTYYPPINDLDSYSSINGADNLPTREEEVVVNRRQPERNITYAELQRRNREAYERSVINRKRRQGILPPSPPPERMEN